MPPTVIAALIIAVLLLCGTVILPAVNKRQFNRLPFEQKVRILMKEANGLNYIKNVSFGENGTLYYVKNKRKICCIPWETADGALRCTKAPLFDVWDYPDGYAFTDEEIQQTKEALKEHFSDKKMKLIIDDKADE